MVREVGKLKIKWHLTCMTGALEGVERACQIGWIVGIPVEGLVSRLGGAEIRGGWDLGLERGTLACLGAALFGL